MTKFVVSNPQVAHLWANQSQEHARSGSMSFRGLNLYSYSTCIAALHPLAMRTDPVALLNSRKYSATTSSRHMPAVRRALNGLGYIVLSVPEVYNAGPHIGLGARAHSINQSYLSARYKDYAAKLMRAQSLGDWNHERLLELRADTIRYAHAFDLVELRHNAAEDWSNALARQTRLANDPKRQARIAAREAARAAKEARTRLAIEMRNVEYLAAFRQGSASYGYNLTDRDGAAYLRLSSDGQTVQTSRGAKVPAADARRAISLIRATKDQGVGWDGAVQVGQFRMTHIAPNGDIVAGCHLIKWSEIEVISALIGL